MIPPLGQHIKCFLRNGNAIEGTVEYWGPEQVRLKSLDGKNLMIIHAPEQDIMLTKILLSSDLSLKSPEPDDGKLTQIEDAINALPDDEEKIDPMALRAKSVAELKVELAIQERKIIADKLKEHQPNLTGAPKKIQYSYPGFFKKTE